VGNTNWVGHNYASLLKQYKENVNSNVVLVIVRVGDGSPGFRDRLACKEFTPTAVIIDD
jgi:hypothetical protein